MNPSITIARHCVPQDSLTGLSPLQIKLLHHSARVRIADAPTGAGKSYAFQRGLLTQEMRILFIVPTRRLAQNLLRGLLEDLEHAGWSEEKRLAKVALWSSDATLQLKNAGIRQIGARRIREIHRLDATRQDGEMIIAIPEVVSRILLRPFPQQGQSDTGIFDFLTSFDHIVFDEFHTISARGFGLAAVFAKLAADGEGRAKVSFLSATPLAIQPVLERLQVSDVVSLRETVGTEGRAVHGDVILSFWERKTLADLLAEQRELLSHELAEQQQVVIIYNELRELQRQIPQLEAFVKQLGIAPQDCLLLNSIDDSRPDIKIAGQFAVGRFQKPEHFKLLIATANIEVGVTFRARVLLMEPGFEPLNFLQRYGRAARGDVCGQVLVRWDKQMAEGHTWVRGLIRWVTERTGQTVQIQDLTAKLANEVTQSFKINELYFGALSNRAVFCAGLYWYLLLKHPSNQGHRRERLFQHQPKQTGQIAVWLKQVREMERDPLFGKAAKRWCDGFEAQAQVLRDMGQTIRIVSESGETREVREIWLQRNTDILTRGHWTVGDDGREEVHFAGEWRISEEKRYVLETVAVLFPHTQDTRVLATKELVKTWCRALRERRGTDVWEEFPLAMEAAIKLVETTGLVVIAEEEGGLEVSSGVL